MDRTAWRLAGNAALLTRSWDDEHVIYHPAAGNTHLLGDGAAQVLSLLQAQKLGSPALSNGAVRTADLATALAAYCSPDEQAHVEELSMTILSDLESLGLIERTQL